MTQPYCSKCKGLDDEMVDCEHCNGSGVEPSEAGGVQQLKEEVRKEFDEKFGKVGWHPTNKQRLLVFLDSTIDRVVRETREEIKKQVELMAGSDKCPDGREHDWYESDGVEFCGHCMAHKEIWEANIWWRDNLIDLLTHS